MSRELATVSPSAELLVMMSAEEARETIDHIKERFGEIRYLILDLYEREGWRALGYDSWTDCARKEFKDSERHVFRLLDAAKSEKELRTILGFTDQLVSKPDPIPESHLRMLTGLEPEQRKRVYQESLETAPNGELTAAHIRQTRNRVLEKEQQAAQGPDRQLSLVIEQARRNRIKHLIEHLQERLLTKVTITASKKAGVIAIHFYGDAELNRVLERLGVTG
jgi:hypothetical protein